MIGILNVYKPKGMTSHNVVSFVRRQLNIKRVGHTGTLDPQAVGVLPVLIGNATRLSDLIMADEKKYTARVVLGITTDTEDTTGEVIERKEVSVTEEQLKETVKKFVGDIEQVPPMYSAIKVDGQKLYQLARKGVEIERAPRKIKIYSIDIYDFDGTSFMMDVHCGKGTYIRSLCRDIGESLSCGAAMDTLERTMSGVFTLDAAHTFDEIEQAVKEGKIEDIILAPDSVLGDYERIDVAEENASKIKNGIRLRPEQLGIKEYEENQLFRIYEKGELICLLKIKDCDGKMLLTMEKSFY
ncbi:MAG: tRNA pseudouridine(55) synthase TruB [Clostridia bacterium]|nr:tRNA pseudouridine(55) synthase TruB [Clostridia bacterium]